MSTAISRLKKEYTRISKLDSPSTQFIVSPDEKNFLRWHFVLRNLEGPYKGGIYHGELSFPSEYPFKPPSLTFHTPSGRFDVGKKVCLSFTNYHPETWNPYWRVESMIESIITFMYTNDKTTGGISCSDCYKARYARDSWKFNETKNPDYLRNFKRFKLCPEINRNQRKEEEKDFLEGIKCPSYISVPLSISLLLGAAFYVLG